MSDKIGDILQRLGYAQKSDIEKALEMQNLEESGRKIGEILRDYSLKEEELLHALSIQNGGYEIDSTLAIISNLLKQRMHQGDIKNLLNSLSKLGHDVFIDKIADILNKIGVFFEISYKLSGSTSLDTILKKIIEISNDALESDRGTIFLLDKESGELYSRITQGELVREIRFPSHKGIAGAVFTTGQPIIIHDAYSDSRFNKEVDKSTGYVTRNILCAPIKTRSSEIIGAIQLLNKNRGSFTSDDLTLLEAITTQASTSLLNIQLFEQIKKSREEEMQLLEVTTAISTELKLEPLLFKIMEATTNILDADRSTLFMYDERTDELWSLVAQGSESAEIRFPSSKGIAGSVFTTKEVVNIPDAYNDDRFNPEFDKKSGYKTRSILCIPVLNKNNESIGAIQVLNKKGGPFLKFDEKRLSAFAAQASIAIENAKLFEEVLNMKNYNESILESMTNGVITLDSTKKIIKCNSSVEKIIKFSPDEITEKFATEIFAKKNIWVIESINKVIKSGKQDINMDIDFVINDDEKVSINSTIVPLKNIKHDVIGYMLIFEDITTEKRLKGTMAKYMPKGVMEKLLENDSGVLGGQVKEATVFFSDIRKFTTISERLGAKKTVSMLNEYFTSMVDIIFKYNGILDKYIGDAILAVFGTPFPTEKDADDTVNAAIEMMIELNNINKKMDEPINIGIGINTDEVLVGNIGSQKRMDYTVIGDGVNLASRLEGVNKFFGTNILISEFTFKKLKGNFKTREIDHIRVKGKNKPVGVYEILDFHNEKSFPNLEISLDNYIKGLKYYKTKNWKEALYYFDKIDKLNPKDRVSEVYRKRCNFFIENPPDPHWDGVWIMEEK